MDDDDETAPTRKREHSHNKIANLPHKEIPQRLTSYGGLILRDDVEDRRRKAWNKISKRGQYAY